MLYLYWPTVIKVFNIFRSSFPKLCSDTSKENIENSDQGWASGRCKHEKFYLRNTVLCKQILETQVIDVTIRNKIEENQSDISEIDTEVEIMTETSVSPQIATENSIKTVETTITS